MGRFVFMLSLLVVILALTTCRASAQIPPCLANSPVYMANGTGMPYYGPDSGLFPQPVPSALNRVSLPLPSAGGLLDFIQTLILGFLAHILRRQNHAMGA